MSREKFEAWASDDGKFPLAVERAGDSYRFLATQNNWETWQAATASMQAERDQLAAECAGMDAFVKDMLAIAWQGVTADGADIQKLALKHELIRQEVYCQDEHENLVYDPSNFENGDPVYFRIETPVTDRFLAEQRAQGVESSIKTISMMLNHQAPGVKDAIKVLEVHAAQLRNEVNV